MRSHKWIILVMGIMVVLLTLGGCSSNPMSSKQVSSSIDDTAAKPADGGAAEDDGDCIQGGYCTTPTQRDSKYEQNPAEDCRVESACLSRDSL